MRRFNQATPERVRVPIPSQMVDYFVLWKIRQELSRSTLRLENLCVEKTGFSSLDHRLRSECAGFSHSDLTLFVERKDSLEEL